MVQKNKIYTKAQVTQTIKESKGEKTSKSEGRRKKAQKRTRKTKQMMLSVFVSLNQAYPCN